LQILKNKVLCYYTCFFGKKSYIKSMNAILSEKGQLTIPKMIRDALGLVPGMVLELRAIGGKLIGHKVLNQDVFQKWRGRGKLPKKMRVDQYLKAVRDGHGG
jgi:antitoxin PrlF